MRSVMLAHWRLCAIFSASVGWGSHIVASADGGTTWSLRSLLSAGTECQMAQVCATSVRALVSTKMMPV